MCKHYLYSVVSVSQILVWRLVPRTGSSNLLCSDEVDAPGVENRGNVHFSDKKYMAVHIGRLKEHEGSIFRIAWSADGSKFMSVSDDRRFGPFWGSLSLYYCLRFPLLKYLASGTLLLHMPFVCTVGLMCFALLFWQCSHVDVKLPATKFY